MVCDRPVKAAREEREGDNDVGEASQREAFQVIKGIIDMLSIEGRSALRVLFSGSMRWRSWELGVGPWRPLVTLAVSFHASNQSGESRATSRSIQVLGTLPQPSIYSFEGQGVQTIGLFRHHNASTNAAASLSSTFQP